MEIIFFEEGKQINWVQQSELETAVDSGFVPNDYQVGQLERENLICSRISGAIQHLLG